MIPPEETALKLLEKVEGQAADAIEFRDPDRYFVANGIDLLLEDLWPDFKEKRVHNIGELTRAMRTFLARKARASTIFFYASATFRQR